MLLTIYFEYESVDMYIIMITMIDSCIQWTLYSNSLKWGHACIKYVPNCAL